MNELMQILAMYPNRSIAEVARLTNIRMIELSQAQHAHMKRIIKRDSPLWGSDNEVIREN